INHGQSVGQPPVAGGGPCPVAVDVRGRNHLSGRVVLPDADIVLVVRPNGAVLVVDDDALREDALGEVHHAVHEQVDLGVVAVLLGGEAVGLGHGDVCGP